MVSVYGKSCTNMRCPSFDKHEICVRRMTDSTKLKDITNWPERQQLNEVLCRYLFISDWLFNSKNYAVLLFKLHLSYLTTFLYRTGLLCSCNDFLVNISLSLTAWLPVRFFKGVTVLLFGQKILGTFWVKILPFLTVASRILHSAFSYSNLQR